MTKGDAIMSAVAQMAMLKFFPSDEFARTAIMGLLDSIALPGAQGVAQIGAFTTWFLSRYNDWPGPQEVRALWCTKWKPADGIEANLQMRRPGENHPVTEENEARYFAGHDDRKRLTGEAEGSAMKFLAAATQRKKPA